MFSSAKLVAKIVAGGMSLKVVGRVVDQAEIDLVGVDVVMEFFDSNSKQFGNTKTYVMSNNTFESADISSIFRGVKKTGPVTINVRFADQSSFGESTIRLSY